MLSTTHSLYRKVIQTLFRQLLSIILTESKGSAPFGNSVDLRVCVYLYVCENSAKWQVISSLYVLSKNLIMLSYPSFKFVYSLTWGKESQKTREIVLSIQIFQIREICSFLFSCGLLCRCHFNTSYSIFMALKQSSKKDCMSLPSTFPPVTQWGCWLK